MPRALVAALLLGALLGTLRWWPADSLQSLMPPDWQCRSWQGSIWQGQCLALRRGQSEWGSIAWTASLRLRPSPAPIVDLRWQPVSQGNNAHVQAQLLPGRALHLQSISLQLELSTLQSLFQERRAPLGGPFPGGIEGHIEGRLDELRVDAGELLAVRGDVVLRASLGGIDLGGYEARFDTPPAGEGRPLAELRELDGPLRIRGRMEFPPGRRVRIFGSVSSSSASAGDARLLPAAALALGLASVDTSGGTLNLSHEIRW